MASRIVIAVFFALASVAFACNNFCYLDKSIARAICSLSTGCLVKRCTLRIGRVRVNGWKCSAAPSPSPSSSPVPATPTPSPSPSPIVLVSCSLNIGNNLDFDCTCKDAADNEYTTTVEASAYFDGTDTMSKSCFGSCLYYNVESTCSVPFSSSTFVDEVTSNVSYCCSSCDGEARGGVCYPFNG